MDRVVGTVPDLSDQLSQSLAGAFEPAGLEAAEFNLPEWLFDLLPAAVYVCDREGAILKFNNLAAELWGRQPSTGSSGERFCGSTRLYRPDGTPLPHEQCPMAVALRTGTPVRDEEVVIERADGSRGFALVNINVLKDDAGQVLGAVNCFLDITGRKHAEQAEQKARAQVERLSEELRSERDELRESERRYHALIDALPAAVYTTDAAGRLTYYNEAAADLWGCRPEIGKSEFCGSWKLYWPDGTPLPHDQCPMAMALREGRPVRGLEAIAERPDGTRANFLPYPTPLFNAAGNLVGAINMLVDVTERIGIERRARHSEALLAAIVEFSDDAIVSKDLNGIIRSWNKGAERLLGYKAAEVIGKPIKLLIPPDREGEEVEILARIRRGERIEHFETVRRHKDGGLIDISLAISPIKDAQGVIVGASKIARDITEKKRAEQTKELLLHEIKHRVKNTLATVQSIATRTFGSAVEGEHEAFVSRIQNLGNAYDLLQRHDWGRPPAREVIDKALKPFCDSHQSRISVSGANALLESGKSLLLSLVLNELGTNAMKYGALSNATGKVSVNTELTEREGMLALKLTWRETGGPPVKPSARKGFGTHLISRAARHGLGEVEFNFAPHGIACTLCMPL